MPVTLTDPWLLYLLAGVLGAVLASFGNVVISRLPRALGFVESEGLPKDIVAAPSACEICRERLKPLELIPVISFIILRGRCSECGAAIGIRHFVVEVLGVLIGLAVLWRFGMTAEAGLAGACLLLLVILAVIDFETGYLPDVLTIPLGVLGLVAAAFGAGPELTFALAGAAIGGGTLFLLAAGYARLRGREGLGGGDVKLVAAAGAWLGPFALPPLILGASLAALLSAMVSMARGAKETALSAEIRFGPYLAASFAGVLLIGEPLTLIP